MVIAPVELADFFGNAYITKDATGTSSGWEWRVTGSEKVGSTNMWKVSPVIATCATSVWGTPP